MGHGDLADHDGFGKSGRLRLTSSSRAPDSRFLADLVSTFLNRVFWERPDGRTVQASACAHGGPLAGQLFCFGSACAHAGRCQVNFFPNLHTHPLYSLSPCLVSPQTLRFRAGDSNYKISFGHDGVPHPLMWALNPGYLRGRTHSIIPPLFFPGPG